MGRYMRLFRRLTDRLFRKAPSREYQEEEVDLQDEPVMLSIYGDGGRISRFAIRQTQIPLTIIRLKSLCIFGEGTLPIEKDASQHRSIMLTAWNTTIESLTS
jgi:hypothetical protein